MNKKDLSAVLLASVLGGAAFVAPVLAEETNTDPQEVETAPVEETTTVEQAETSTPVYINQFQTENGSTYYFDNNGNKVTGIQTIGSDVYYFDGNGVLQSNVEYEGYYFGVDGKAVKSDWVEFTNGYKYYDENGQVVKSTSTSPVMKEIDGKKYYFDQNGIRTDEYKVESDISAANTKVNTWYQNDAGYTYYYDENGNYLKNCFYRIDGKKYHFNNSGWLEIGPFADSGQLYITDNNGVVQTKKGWQQFNFDWYYIKEDGTLMKDEWFTENGKTYYFTSAGCIATSKTLTINGALYSFDANGILQDSLTNFTGWRQFEGVWYYSKNGETDYTGRVGDYLVVDGKMAVNQIVDDTYYVDYNGKIQKGWIKTYDVYDGTKQIWHYANPTTGVLAKDQWLTIGNKTYYFMEHSMVTGICIVDQAYYDFGTDGALKGKTKPNSWVKKPDGHWMYLDENGNICYDRKIIIDGVTYYFNGTGVALVGGYINLAENCSWYNPDDNYYYWTNKTGTALDMTSGWKKSNEGLYGYVENGKLVQGFKTINGKVYYFNFDGYLLSGVENINGKAYAYDSNGNAIECKEGWNALDNQWFYVKNGMAVMNKQIDGYYINQYGVTATGKDIVTGGNWNILLKQGRLARNQWVKQDGFWYYGDENGRMVTNSWVGKYYFDAYGHMVRNAWMGKYYIGDDGLYYPSQWVKTNGKYWYRHTDGSYTRNNFEKIYGKWYYFDSNGYRITGWKKVGSTWYYFTSSGEMASNQWVGDYYFEASGAMATNKWIGNYYVGADGKWVH
ncbi:hypothetical protein [uncultured Holdemanella sp.]|uniref:hypothetical protein n=1 Tax=uncultured Holdemanella sp. TaxID=1763549 RepID=UPI0028060670|nr:hypothetical protein [uncultured Holdemanella sp.]